MALDIHTQRLLEAHNAENARPFTEEELEELETEAMLLSMSAGHTVYESIPHGMREISDETLRKPEENFVLEKEERQERHLPDHLREILEQKQSLYSAGNKTEAEMQERAILEQILLQLQETGENMTEIARALGMYIKPTSGRSEAMARALKRARKARSEAQSQGT